MIAYILLGLLGIALIVGIFLWIFGKYKESWYVKEYGTAKTTGVVMSVISFGFLFILSIITISSIKSYKEEINAFKKQKEYIEHVAPTLPTTDNYALTIKRIEQNQWLYEIQYKYENYRFWHLIPEEVLNLTPIK